jgi:uncharacterized protein YcgI (DUF1989 family)
VSQALVGHVAIRAERIEPGAACALTVSKGQLIQIITLDGRQAAEMAAVSAEDATERLSPGVTRAKNKSVLIKKGQTLYSSRFAPMFELVEDTVGRHDLLLATSEPTKPAGDEEPAHPLTSAGAALGMDLTLDLLVEPVNWFVNVTIKQKGELEVAESLAEPDDYVLLRALVDTHVVIGARPNMAGTGIQASPLLVRVFR